MMQSAYSWLRDFIQSLRRRLRRQPSLGDLSADELRRERVRLEQAEAKSVREIERMEADKLRLFAEAKTELSQSVRQVKARQIRDLNHRLEAAQVTLNRVGKIIQVVDQVMAQHEIGRMSGETSPIVQSIRDTDALDLQDWASDLIAQQTVTEEKVDDLIEGFHDAVAYEGRLVKEDEEVSAILAEIERAQSAEAVAEELALPRQAESPAPETGEIER